MPKVKKMFKYQRDKSPENHIPPFFPETPYIMKTCCFSESSIKSYVGTMAQRADHISDALGVDREEALLCVLLHDFERHADKGHAEGWMVTVLDVALSARRQEARDRLV